MTNPIEFGLALSNSHPSGTGSFSYEGQFNIIVENLNFQKQVAVRAQFGSIWKDINASYVDSLSENRELWAAPATDSEGDFAAKYTVNGVTYWDNNQGKNYKFPQAFDEFLALAGDNYKVILGSAGMAGGTLKVDIGVQNLAFTKTLGILYTTDNWNTTQKAFGSFGHTMKSGLEIWEVIVPIGASSEVKFAIFYQVSGNEYWDNNFWRNYRVTPTTTQRWGINP